MFAYVVIWKANIGSIPNQSIAAYVLLALCVLLQVTAKLSMLCVKKNICIFPCQLDGMVSQRLDFLD